MPKDIIVGINIHNSHYSPYAKTLEQNLDDCAKMGLKIVRYNAWGSSPEALEEIRMVSEGCHKRGMKLLLCMGGISSWKDTSRTHAQLEEAYEKHMENISATLKDAVDIYQLFNETDVACMGGDIFNITVPGKDGRELGEYDSVMVGNCIAAMKGGLKGIKKGYTKAVTSMNFAWWHTALIYEMYRQGCRWDVIGLDWYSDCEEVSSIDLIVKEVCDNIHESDIMIHETNQWMNFHARWDKEKCALIENRETRNALQAEWVPSFIQKVYDLKEPRFKGIVFYELLDEPGFERNAGHYHGESHFGFIECDEQGGNRVYKPVFETATKKIKELGL